jgi:hypothetical protein
MQPGDWISLAGFVATVIGLGFAGVGIRRGNQNSSAASLLAFNEAVRGGWERFLSADDENKKGHQFAELANLLEIASAFQVKGIFVGVSRELLTEYLDDVLRLLDGNDDAKRRLAELAHSDTTFKYLKAFRKKRKTSTILTGKEEVENAN